MQTPSSFRRYLRSARVASALLALGASGAASAVSYTFTDLGVLAGNYSTAASINNAGLIVGQSLVAFGPFGDVAHATLWSNGSITDLTPSLTQWQSQARAINNAGVIVGLANDIGVQWVSGLSGSTSVGSAGFRPATINDAGAIAGMVFQPQTFSSTAALVTGSTTTLLPPVVSYSYAYGINTSGVVVGNVGSEGATWTAGMARPLLAVGGTYDVTQAYGINDAGQLVG